MMGDASGQPQAKQLLPRSSRCSCFVGSARDFVHLLHFERLRLQHSVSNAATLLIEAIEMAGL